VNAVNGAVLLILGALLVALLYALRATPRARNATPPPVVLNQPAKCRTTGCAYPGWIVTRDRHGDTARVCAGCYSDGVIRGWWATTEDVTR